MKQRTIKIMFVQMKEDDVMYVWKKQWDRIVKRLPGMKTDIRYKTEMFRQFLDQLDKGKLVNDVVLDKADMLFRKSI